MRYDHRLPFCLYPAVRHRASELLNGLLLSACNGYSAMLPSPSEPKSGRILSAEMIRPFILLILPFLMRFSKSSNTKNVFMRLINCSIAGTISSLVLPSSISARVLIATRISPAEALLESKTCTSPPFSSARFLPTMALA